MIYNIPINTYHFFIEGNIGAGKTTLWNNLKEYFNILKITNNIKFFFLNEPINVWTQSFTNENGIEENYFEEHYKNPERHFQGFQSRVLSSYFRLFNNLYKEINELDENIIKIIISDRSPYTMKKVFYDGLKEKYKITKYEIDTYERLYEDFFENFTKEYNIIYINTPLHECYNNKNKRLRNGEENISISFLALLESSTCNYIYECLSNNIKVLYYSYYNNNKIEEVIDFIYNNIINMGNKIIIKNK
jgi:deoxyadenosine/deoxycytidine kinase